MFYQQLEHPWRRCLSAFFLLGWMPLAFAAFGVMDNSEESCYGAEEDPYYGAAQDARFKKAIDGSDCLTKSEQRFMAGVDQTRVTDRWFIRFLLGNPKARLMHFTAKSPSLALIQNTAQQSVKELFLAVGHVWESWSVDFELFAAKQFKYQADPLFSTGTATGQAAIKQFGLLFNLEYIFPHWFNLYPSHLQFYINGGLGGSFKLIDSSGTDNFGIFTQRNSRRGISPIGVLGGGLRYQVTPNFLLGAAYRYMHGGTVKAGPFGGVDLKSKELRSQGVFLDITFQF